MTSKLEKKISFLKYYQLTGVILGLLLLIYLMLNLNFSEIKLFEIGIVSLMIIFFGLNFYVYLLLKKKKYVLGLKWFSFLLILQLISITIDDFFYSAVNLFGLNFVLDFTKDSIIGFDFQVSHIMLTFTSNFETFLVKLNLVAIFMLFYISKIYQELKDINIKI